MSCSWGKQTPHFSYVAFQSLCSAPGLVVGALMTVDFLCCCLMPLMSVCNKSYLILNLLSQFLLKTYTKPLVDRRIISMLIKSRHRSLPQAVQVMLSFPVPGSYESLEREKRLQGKKDTLLFF